MDVRIAQWLASGDTGMSSKAIMLWLSAGVKEDRWGAATPGDPADLGRCLRLLERIPEWKERIGEMAGAGGYWPTFVRRWDEMADSMEREVGIHWEKGKKAPLTYKLMGAVEREARDAGSADFQEVDLGTGMKMRFGK